MGRVLCETIVLRRDAKASAAVLQIPLDSTTLLKFSLKFYVWYWARGRGLAGRRN